MTYRSNIQAVYKGIADKIADLSIQPYSPALTDISDLSLASSTGSALMVSGGDIVLSRDVSSSLILPSGDTASRPTATRHGMLRYNNATGVMELFTGSVWQTVVVRGNASDAVNWLQLEEANKDGSPTLMAAGADANVSIMLQPKGNGHILSPLGYDMAQAPQNALATKIYVDWEIEQALTLIGDYLPLSGGSVTGLLRLVPGARLELPASPTDAPSIFFEGEPDTGLTLYGSNQIAFVADGAPILHIQGLDEPGSGANHIHVTNALPGDAPSIGAHGSDDNVDLILMSSGSGVIRAQDGYSMNDGPDEAFATKGYVDYLTEIAPHTNEIYVGKHGSDENSGRNRQQALFSLQAAIALAESIATEDSPIRIIMVPGDYEVANPITISNPHIEIAGSGFTTTHIRPMSSGQPVFDVYASGPTGGARFTDFLIAGDVAYAGSAGSIGFRLNGNGRFTFEEIGIIACNVGIDVGNGTFASQKTNFSGFVYSCRFGVRTRSTSEIVLNRLDFSGNGTAVDSLDQSRVVANVISIDGALRPDSVAIRASGSSRFQGSGMTLTNSNVGLQLRDSCVASIRDTHLSNNTTDISQVNETAAGDFYYGRLDSSKIVAVNPQNLRLFYTDTAGDLIVGHEIILLRQSDGKLFLGNAQAETTKDIGTEARINIIDDAAASLRIWQHANNGSAALELVHGVDSVAENNSRWSLSLKASDSLSLVRHGETDQELLHVATDQIIARTVIAVPDGDVADPAIRFASSPSSGLAYVDDRLTLVHGGQAVVRIDGSEAGNSITISSGSSPAISANGEGNVDLVVSPQGAGVVKAPPGYGMASGPAESFATKAYVDDIISSRVISTIQVAQLLGTDQLLSGQMLFLTDMTRAGKILSVETTGFNFARSVVSDNSWINLPQLSSASSGYIMPYDGTVIRASIYCDDVADESMDFSVYIDEVEHGEVLSLGGSAAVVQNDNNRIDADFSAGAKLRLRARNGTGTIGAVSAMIWVKWKYTAN